jgi:L-alanine-DL-glutamate epimerase-like enolase superfamily enzyme
VATTITRVRPVLLSAPYGDPVSSAENLLHLPSGYRTCGLVEVTLSDGTVGLGEAYLAVFAPQVFVSIVELVSPLLVGRDAADVSARVRDVVTATGYWSFQGAARHVVGAIEMALLDGAARVAGVPLWRFLGAADARADAHTADAPPLEVYASGGDSITPHAMLGELERVAALGIRSFKIRGRAHQVDKVAWTQRQAATAGIGVAVDMTQNLVVPSQSPREVLEFTQRLVDASGVLPLFLEEVLGPDRIDELPGLRAESSVPIAGGEIVTTEGELVGRIRAGAYDIAQPDATVIGGIGPVLEVFAAARETDARVFVHCWGGGVGVVANYHAALAGGGTMVEWPLPDYSLRSVLLEGVVSIVEGSAVLSERPGLGVELTPEIEREFAFREDAVYDCLVEGSRVPSEHGWGG